jgi:hypothetical protein
VVLFRGEFDHESQHLFIAGKISPGHVTVLTQLPKRDQ